MQSLADFLRNPDADRVDPVDLTDISDPKEFAVAFLASRDFRVYLRDTLKAGMLPAAITTRLMDYAWGQPVKKVEFKDTTDLARMSKHEIMSQIAALTELAQELPDEHDDAVTTTLH